MMGTALKLVGNPVALLAIAFGVLFGLYKWRGESMKDAEARLDAAKQSVAMAEDEIARVAKIANHNKDLVDAWQAHVEFQKGEAAKLKKKADDRLRENNELRRKINDATENPPVPDAIELVLDSIRLRSAVPGTPGADDGDKDRGGGEADSDRDEVPGATAPAAETPGS